MKRNHRLHVCSAPRVPVFPGTKATNKLIFLDQFRYEKGVEA